MFLRCLSYLGHNPTLDFFDAMTRSVGKEAF